MKSNIEIVKEVLDDTGMFHSAYVDEYSSEKEVKIVTRVAFVRLTDLDTLRYGIEREGGHLEEIEVSTMPAMDNRLSVVVVFEK